HLQNKWVLKLQDPGFGTRRYSDDAYNYSTFVRFLTDQGAPRPELFEGSFLRLDNSTVTIMPR
ncbi:hypothetical protein CHQ87_0021285, partial [Escherichia coli]